jgi:hypothetical protein
LKTRRRLTLLGAMFAVLLGLGGQQAATADEVPTQDDRRRGWGCVHVAGVKVGLCLYDPLHLPTD